MTVQTYLEIPYRPANLKTLRISTLLSKGGTHIVTLHTYSNLDHTLSCRIYSASALSMSMVFNSVSAFRKKCTSLSYWPVYEFVL